MGDLPAWVVPALVAAIVVIIVLIILSVALGRRKTQRLEADRARATELREEARAQEFGSRERQIEAQEADARAQEADAQAQEADAEAERAQLQADRRAEDARLRREAADRDRSAVDEKVREAEQIDPDNGPAGRTGHAGTGTAAGTDAGPDYGYPQEPTIGVEPDRNYPDQSYPDQSPRTGPRTGHAAPPAEGGEALPTYEDAWRYEAESPNARRGTHRGEPMPDEEHPAEPTRRSRPPQSGEGHRPEDDAPRDVR